MADYNSIQEMPDDVLTDNIRIFERVIANIKKRKGSGEAIINMEKLIQRWKSELACRKPDSLTDV